MTIGAQQLFSLSEFTRILICHVLKYLLLTILCFWDLLSVPSVVSEENVLQCFCFVFVIWKNLILSPQGDTLKSIRLS